MNMTDLPKENLDLASMANLQQNKIKSAHTKRIAINTEKHERKGETMCLCDVHLVWSTSLQMFAHGIGKQDTLIFTNIMRLKASHKEHMIIQGDVLRTL